ncbi:hypothetical protein BTM25_15690 [Actinomadura rubteroloni]|uniref:DUF397 domain-containing protein n=1 Tax=Actinomadura rubteroloni TaxID=1926885 RepID=A0A2P4UQ29_9ACTN|nr:DUF397 domain-containing protein [Actinomadura rubteroloni]POM27158.1 hypothetical protein BTM25_15690 [Actinomadura rubteroloni]
MTPLTWQKSSHSGTGGSRSDCVEVAPLTRAIAVRDSKRPDAGHLTLTPETFAALLTRARNARA